MVWDQWDILKFHYAAKKPDFSLKYIYNYVRGLYIINEAIEERKLYMTIDISSRKEYNKVVLGVSSKLIPDIERSLEVLNTRLFKFEKDVTIDHVASTLNSEMIPCPIDLRDILQDY